LKLYARLPQALLSAIVKIKIVNHSPWIHMGIKGVGTSMADSTELGGTRPVQVSLPLKFQLLQYPYGSLGCGWLSSSSQ